MERTQLIQLLSKGGVIPAHPLALTADRKLDERHQRALTRYYLDAGVAGITVGVHTTQFAIRQRGLYTPVLSLAADTLEEWLQPDDPFIRIAGIIGHTDQARSEATIASQLGYDLGLVGLGGLQMDETKLITHLRAVADIIPIMGFYLQPAVGGRVLSYSFWRKACEIENFLAIKISPFNRYYTLDVVRAVIESDRCNEIALYTGNDDSIVVDLLTRFDFGNGQPKYIVGGLLGHWAVWTKRAVELMDRIHLFIRNSSPIPHGWLTEAARITDSNAAFFDPQHNFAGCIAGIHETLRRQGLMANNFTLDPNEGLSPGQSEEINRVYASYPDLNDDQFVAEHLDEWLR